MLIYGCKYLWEKVNKGAEKERKLYSNKSHINQLSKIILRVAFNNSTENFENHNCQHIKKIYLVMSDSIFPQPPLISFKRDKKISNFLFTSRNIGARNFYEKLTITMVTL